MIPLGAAEYSFLNEVAAEARAESRRYWAASNDKYPSRKRARFWPLHRPIDRGDCINARAVRVLCVINELLRFGNVEAVEELIIREIERVPP